MNMIFYLTLAATALAGVTGLFLALFGLHAVLQERRRDRVPALLYHQFLERERVESGEVVNSERVYACYDTDFTEQMAYLRREGYTTISLEDFLAFRRGERDLPPRSIILTIDDGFSSTYRIAFPILKRYGMKATLFFTPDRECENFKRFAHLDSPLTDARLREMSENGVSIESHTMTHPYLTELDDNTLTWELTEARRVLEKTVGKPARFLAIPSGAYDGRVRRQVKAAGYEAAFCMLKGTNNASTDLFRLRRLVVPGDYRLEDFEKTLGLWAGVQLRITGFFQDLLFNRIVGPGRFDALRDSLYQSRLGALLARGQLRYFVGSLAVAIVAVIILGTIILLRR